MCYDEIDEVVDNPSIVCEAPTNFGDVIICSVSWIVAGVVCCFFIYGCFGGFAR